jgi:DNA-binding MarR family transcriptional regulator
METPSEGFQLLLLKGKSLKMKKMSAAESSFNLWLLIGKVNHSIMLIRQRELNQHHIPVRQTLVLYTIQALGDKATLSEVARLVEREVHVVSRQAVSMEKDGLIKRIKNTPKSNLLRLELTEKGQEMVKVARESESISEILAFLTAGERKQMELILNRILTSVEKYHVD